MEFAGLGVASTSEQGTTISNVFGYGIQQSVKDSVESGKRVFDPERDYTFNDPDRIRELSVHEFGHAFVNPVAEKYKEKINTYSYLYKPIEQKMTKLSYRNWWDCSVEHVVRAGEVRIATIMGQHERAHQLLNKYVKEYNFVYLPQIVEALKVYELNRSTYSSFSEFFPELVNVFENIEPLKSDSTNVR